MIAIIKRIIEIGLCAGFLFSVSACDNPHLLTGETERQTNQQHMGSTLIELPSNVTRPPLNTNISGLSLPTPGSVPPLAPAPNLAEIEKQMFASLQTDGLSATTYSTTFSQLEVDLITQAGARKANAQIRQELSSIDSKNVSEQPMNHLAEIQRLRQLGIRTSPR